MSGARLGAERHGCRKQLREHPGLVSGTLAAQLVLLYDGAMVGAHLDQSQAPGVAARSATGPGCLG